MLTRKLVSGIISNEGDLHLDLFFKEDAGSGWESRHFLFPQSCSMVFALVARLLMQMLMMIPEEIIRQQPNTFQKGFSMILHEGNGDK